jgi:hypothetical protein
MVVLKCQTIYYINYQYFIKNSQGLLIFLTPNGEAIAFEIVVSGDVGAAAVDSYHPGFICILHLPLPA